MHQMDEIFIISYIFFFHRNYFKQNIQTQTNAQFATQLK